MKKINKIKESMKIEEVIGNFPETSAVFAKYGLHCVGCPMATPETILEAAKLHGIDIKKFLKELKVAAGQ